MEKRKLKRLMRKGFTMVELLIAVAIVAIFAVAFYLYNRNNLIDTKATKIAEETNKLETALNLFEEQTGYMPSSIQELWKNADANGNPIPGWSGPYVQPPGGDTSATSLKSGSGATITVSCDSTNGVEQIVFSNVPKNVAEAYDEKYDDGNLSSGNAVYDDTNHTLTITVSSNVSCI
ncbi:hypothetical protein Theam_1803 (plasmid) [Thermovibrio ammonificans HB-1]|uniref:Uncharacterized protein n=1 Tax=Thermovibrio ammonificans (strain DSM 15698 / JCM 12110 / HB-1) TaxID=648996 RepID=E8T6T6_THEA1|nr:type II secretion system protein [Thermovibrio ammonificans]ADU97759.1 hypothetical protein Theam_1803 [Thermovibrio ammonificans HB-1]